LLHGKGSKSLGPVGFIGKSREMQAEAQSTLVLKKDIC
jgi:hypothetical protein